MKHYALLLFILCTLSAQAQGNHKIEGTVTDTGNQPLEEVMIGLVANGEEYVAYTTSNGKYELTFDADSTCTLSFHKLGYQSATISLRPQAAQTVNQKLQADKTYEMKEVTVRSSSVITGKGKVSYIPNKQQRNASNSAADLLFHLAIPQLQVDPRTKSVGSYDKSQVAIYIDHRKASEGEVVQLRAKDIKRVEYYENNQSEFPGEEKVVNYVLHHYDTGGYVALDTETRLIEQGGSYSAQAHFDHKKMSYTLLGGTSFSNDDGYGMENTEYVELGTPFVKKTTMLPNGKRNTRTHYGIFRTNFNSEQTSLYAQAKLMHNSMPKSLSLLSAEYSPAVFPASAISTSENSQGNVLSGEFFIRHTLGKSDLFDLQINYNYSDNHYYRLYAEQEAAGDITSQALERTHDLMYKLNYKHTFTPSSGFTLMIWGGQQRSRTNYDGSGGYDIQRLYSHEVAIFPTYYTTLFDQRLYLSGTLGVDFLTYHINNMKSYTKFPPRPSLYASYKVNQHNSLSLLFNVGSLSPRVSTLNTAEQQINAYEVLRGNYDLKTTVFTITRLSHSLNLNHFQLGSYVSYIHYHDGQFDEYTTEGDKLIHSYSTDGDLHNIAAGVNASVSLLKNALRLNGSVRYEHYAITGPHRTHHNNVSASLTTMYYYKHFNAYAYYSFSPTYMKSNLAFVNPQDNYGIAAGWSNKGLQIEAGVERIFSNSKAINQHFDYGYYRYDLNSFSNANGKSAYVKVSYNFDFGRKVKHEKIEVGDAPASSILRAQ